MGSGMMLADKLKNVAGIGTTVMSIMQKIVGPIMIVVGAAALAYVIYLGILYAKAEDAGKRKDAQGRLIGAIIGLVIIIAGITIVYSISWEGVAYSMIEQHPFTETAAGSGVCKDCGLDQAGHNKWFTKG